MQLLLLKTRATPLLMLILSQKGWRDHTAGFRRPMKEKSCRGIHTKSRVLVERGAAVGFPHGKTHSLPRMLAKQCTPRSPSVLLPAPPSPSPVPTPPFHQRIGAREPRVWWSDRSRGSSSSIRKFTIINTPDLEEEVCPICFEVSPRWKWTRGPCGLFYAPSIELDGTIICDCGHGFCERCLIRYVSVSIREGNTRLGTLRCPMPKCTVPMQESLLKDLTSASDWEKHVSFNESRKIEERPLMRLCPQPNCDGVACLSRSIQAKDSGRYLQVQSRTCLYAFCANCASDPHQGKPCDQAGKKEYFDWKRGKSVKSCPGCAHQVEKAGGCRSMRCSRCHTRCCWECGLPRGVCTGFHSADCQAICSFLVFIFLIGAPGALFLALFR